MTRKLQSIREEREKKQTQKIGTIQFVEGDVT